MSVLNKFSEVDTFIFDIDGVLTDGSLLVLENGEMARRMNVKDGYGLQLALKRGYRVFIISGSSPGAVDGRLRNLGIEEIYFRVLDKKDLVQKLITQHGLDSAKILFMGDDMPDLPVFGVVGLSCCPADAANDIKDAAQYISTKNGGRGCVRDVIEKVLKINGHWDGAGEVASA